MHPADPRGDALRAFDAFAHEFARDSAGRCEFGGRLAHTETEQLAALGRRLAREAAEWARAIKALDVAAEAPLDPGEGARLALECVFDPVLTAAASRLLGAALDLALLAP